MEREENPVSFVGIVIWFLASLFFLYEFSLRVFVSTISDDVMKEMHLNAQAFAIMGGAYYIIYSIMQVPVGLLVDKYGVRILLAIAVFIAALGAFGFVFAHGFWFATFNRVFMGFGSAFAYVSLLVLALNWFPRRYFGFAVGVANFFGALGSILACGPLAFVIQLFDNRWRLVLLGISLFGFFLSFIIGCFVRNAPKRKEKIIHLNPYKISLKEQISLLFHNRQAWVIMLYAGIAYVCLPLLGAYWGTAYLQAKGAVRTEAASASSFLWVGVAIGCPLVGMLSDKIKRRKPVLYGCALLGIVASGFILYVPFWSMFLYSLLFFFVGLASSGQSLSFAVISEHVPKEIDATALGMNNSGVTLFAALIPAFISFLIQKSAAVHSVGKAFQYTIGNFQAGLFLMPIIYFISFLIAFLFIKETYCRQQKEVIKVKSE